MNASSGCVPPSGVAELPGEASASTALREGEVVWVVTLLLHEDQRSELCMIKKKNEALFRPVIFVWLIFVGNPVMTGLLDRAGRYTRGRYDVKDMLKCVVLFRLYSSMKSSAYAMCGDFL